MPARRPGPSPGWEGRGTSGQGEVAEPTVVATVQRSGTALGGLIATYGMDGDELHDLMLLVRSLYRGGGQVTRRQALFLHDVSRSLDDLAIDARP
jgi:hypothetical protein